MGTGVFPTELEIARGLPIFKQGDKMQPGNYRPISILSPLSNIFE